MLGPLTGWMSSKPSPSTDGLGADHAELARLAAHHGVVQERRGVLEHAPRPPAEVLGVGAQRGLHVRDHDGDLRDRHGNRWRHDTRAVTACHLIPPRVLLNWALMQVQVPGRVDPVEDGAAAHDDVDTPARDLGRVADGHSAVHADQHVGSGAPGQVTHVVDPLPGAGRGRLAGPAGADREDQDQVGQPRAPARPPAPGCPG